VSIRPDNRLPTQPGDALSPSSERRLEEFAAAIDRDADVPIGLQLGWALSARIHDGELQPGQRLPGLREMAQASGLNVNTVRAVYQRLEQRGLLESRQGSGTFVSSTLRRPSAIGAIAADAAREAEAIGVDPREVAAALYVAMPQDSPSDMVVTDAAVAGVAPDEAGNDAGAEREAVAAPVLAPARRRALRAQIAALERAIGEIEAEHPGLAPLPSAAPGAHASGPTLLGVQELEQVRSGLVRRLALVQSAIDEQASAAAQPAAQGPVETAPEPAPSKRRATVALATP
jgi:DNA-binding transcriptional regulator YhcF (GntR family)